MRAYTDVILSEESDMGQLKSAVDHFYALYSSNTQISAGSLTDEVLKPAYKGVYVSPIHAAHCSLEILRTVMFIRGVHAAMEDALKQNKKLRILYAGCGPYATLITPLTYLFQPEQLEVTLLEIEKTSMNAVKGLYFDLKKEEFVSEYLIADANDPKLSFENDFDIIISETMQMALSNECQVPITRNLVRFLKKDGHFIPNRVRLEVYLAGSKDIINPEKSEFKYLGRAYDLYYKNIPEPNHTTQVSIATTPYDYVELHTEIDVFQNKQLGLNQCSLTMPKTIGRYPKGEKRPKQIKFTYKEEPKIELVRENIW